MNPSKKLVSQKHTWTSCAVSLWNHDIKSKVPEAGGHQLISKSVQLPATWQYGRNWDAWGKRRYRIDVKKIIHRPALETLFLPKLRYMKFVVDKHMGQETQEFSQDSLSVEKDLGSLGHDPTSKWWLNGIRIYWGTSWNKVTSEVFQNGFHPRNDDFSPELVTVPGVGEVGPLDVRVGVLIDASSRESRLVLVLKHGAVGTVPTNFLGSAWQTVCFRQRKKEK